MKIIYWSGTGNTEKMANLIAEGIGNNIDVLSVDQANEELIKNDDLLILGCPAMGDEVLEESEFEPFIEEISSSLNGKKIALFGSYGWGDGQWMRDWEERMISLGCKSVIEPLIIQNEPEGEEANLCVQFGKKIVNA